MQLRAPPQKLTPPLDDDDIDESGTFLATPLSFLNPQETKRVKSARKQRRFIGKLRLFLPLIALVLLIALIIWPALNPNKLASVAMKSLPDFVIKNLHYTGLDSKNEPYSISALKATRPSGAQNLYDLDKPEGELMLSSGNWLAGKAQYGRLDNDTRRLWLGGDVQLFHDKGMQFTTDEAQVNINENYAWGEKPVLIQGGFGEIRGKGFRLLDDGNVMVVLGPAKAILNLHPAAASDKPGAMPK